LLEKEDGYTNLLEKIGFKIIFSKIESIKTNHTPEEVFKIFSSGTIAGYLNQDFYDLKIDEEYIDTFKKIVKDTFVQQTNEQGEVELIFNRVFLVAIKE
jgi:trans-aconitate methyltransferase